MVSFCTRVTFGVVTNLAVSVLVEASLINRFITSIDPPESKIVPYHFSPVPILMVHEANSAAKKNTSDIRQFIKNDPGINGDACQR